jgi:hypothetical protein
MKGHLIDLFFYPSRELYQPSGIGNKLMIQDLIGQTALKISHQWNSKHFTCNLTDDDPLMQMGMDDIRFKPAADREDFEKQQPIDIKLVY